MRKQDLVALVIFTATVGVAVWQYPTLPAMVPTHFGVTGQADSWMPKSSAVLIAPIASLVLYLLLTFMGWLVRDVSYRTPREAPSANLDVSSLHGTRVNETNRIVVLNTRNLMMVMMFLMQVGMFAYARGDKWAMLPSVCVSLSALFIYIGWAVRFTRRNSIVGMRLPWSMADDENWRKTNTFGGNLFIALGILCLLGIAFPTYFVPVLLAAVVLATMAIAIYSYRIYKANPDAQSENCEPS